MDELEASHTSPHDRLEGLIMGYIAFALEESAAYRIAFMLDLALNLEQIHNLQQLVGLRAFSIFHDKIGELQRLNFVRAGLTDMVAQSIWAAMHGLCALLLARPLFPWANQTDLIKFHAELIIKGARA